ncbi:MAG: helix-turn-helix domain-containing protein [Christensenellales bacterium]
MESKKKNESFGGIKPFEMRISYGDIDSKSPYNTHEDHIHDECEIYVNISGDVSFAVENSVYPLMPGGIIITRPHEYHHCIYHSDKQRHRHFCIFFSANGNERLFDIFYNRAIGKENLLMLTPEKSDEMFSVCREMIDGSGCEAENYYRFFTLINLLRSASVSNAPGDDGGDCVIRAINRINGGLSQEMTVREIAGYCNVSVNTLERRFMQALNTSPSEYIKKKKLANAAKLLTEGYGVTEAAELSGFSDCSSFISVFKKYYQTTPLKYKKNIGRKQPLSED